MQPLAQLEETFAPIYLYHRYQLDAAVKSVAGLLYTYALRGDPAGTVKPVDADTQRRALRSALNAMSPGRARYPGSSAATTVAEGLRAQPKS